MKFQKGHKINNGRSPWNKGGTLTKEHKDKIKMSMKGQIRENFIGENNPKWKGGITPINEKIRHSKEYILWRTAVFIRDEYACQECGDNRGGNLEADHIKPFSLYPELRFAIDNGRTLCRPCHQKTETYGWKIRSLITASN